VFVAGNVCHPFPAHDLLAHVKACKAGEGAPLVETMAQARGPTNLPVRALKISAVFGFLVPRI
jgi:hypothetical protein